MRARPALLLAAIPALVCAATLAPRAARACSCMRPGPPLESAEAATVVFEGRASAPVVEGMKHRYTFEVTRSFKGDAGTTAEILTASSGAACGRHYEVGELYLVYAGGNGQLVDGLCSRSRRSAEASEDFAALGEGSPAGGEPTPEPGGGVAEPPRIEDPAAGPPPATPSARGCAVGLTGVPHGPSAGGFAMLVLLGVASTRRRAYRGVRTPRRQDVARSIHDSPTRQRPH